MTQLELQRLAIALYADGEYADPNLTDHEVEEDGALDGDTLALFVWRELGDAQGDPAEAERMLLKAGHQLLHLAEQIATHKSTPA
jgi:hypothetical protein